MRNTCVQVAVNGFITDLDRLLLVLHRERGWELPGGGLLAGETWREGLMREVREESGIEAVLLDLPPVILDCVAFGAPSWLAIVGRGGGKGLPLPRDPDGHIVDACWVTRANVPAKLSPLASVDLVRAWRRGEFR